MVKYAIGTMTKPLRHQIRFGMNAYGKPHFDGTDSVYFNVSHSGDQFFSIAEYEQLMTLPASHRLAYFFDIWTLKESLIKADGRGLSISLDSFSIHKQGSDIQLIAGDEIAKILMCDIRAFS